MPRSESPSEFIYQRVRSMTELEDDDTDFSSSLPSEDESDIPTEYFPFSSYQDYDHDHETAGRQGSDIMASLLADHNIPRNGAQALAIPGIRFTIAKYVHDVCLEGSQDFIREFRENIDQRLSRAESIESRRLEDRISGGFDEEARNLYHNAHISGSLAYNTTMICSILWARGRALQMLCPSSLSTAIEAMMGLYATGENIATIFDVAAHWGDVNEEGVRHTLASGMEYCERLDCMGTSEDLYNLGYWLFEEGRAE